MAYDSLPDELKEKGLFCVWDYENRGSGLTKVPYDPISGKRASSNNKDTFTEYRYAVSEAPDYDGIGIGIFDGVSGLDIDHCIGENGELSETAQDIIRIMHSYTETSPSGKGIHILFFTKDFDYDKEKYYIKNEKAGLEAYVSGATNRFLTCTGNVCAPLSCDIGVRERELGIVLEKYMRREKDVSSPEGGSLSDDEIIMRINRTNADLWNGCYDEEKYSHSEADLALCGILAFWTGKDISRMDRIFRCSCLMRDKWDEKHGAKTYGRMTLEKAAEGCRNVYRPGDGQDFNELIPMDSAPGALPPFPVDALPETIGRFCREVSAFNQVDPGMAAIFALAMLSIANMKKYAVEGKPGYIEPVNLYTLVIANPAERKTPTLKYFMEIVEEYEKQLNDSLRDKIRENENTRDNLKRQIENLEQELKKHYSDADEKELNELQNKLADMPEMFERELFGSDMTTEVIAQALKRNGETFSIISSEGGIFGNFAGRYSKMVNVDLINSAYNGEAVRVFRMTRETVKLDHPLLTIMLAIQPRVVTELMNNSEMRGRGFVARFQMAWPRSYAGKRVWETEPVSEYAKASYKNLMMDLLSTPEPDFPAVLTLDDFARGLIADYNGEAEKAITGDGREAEEWIGKHVGNTLRIAGNIHIAMRKSKDDNVIKGEEMLRAIAISRYLMAHAIYSYGRQGDDLEIQKAKKLINTLKILGKNSVKKSALFNSARCSYFKKTSDIDPTLDLLELYGYIRTQNPQRPANTGRKPVPDIYLNPLVYSLPE